MDIEDKYERLLELAKRMKGALHNVDFDQLPPDGELVCDEFDTFLEECEYEDKWNSSSWC